MNRHLLALPACLLLAACSESRGFEPRVEVVGFEELVAEIQARRGKGLLVNWWAMW